MKFLFIGDIVGRGGRKTVNALVPELRREFNIQFVIANAENCAGGNGMTKKCLDEMSGVVNVFTSGDHTWDQRGFDLEIDSIDNMIRPANYALEQPGRGYGVFQNPAGGKIAVINLQGKVFIRESAYCPFETVEKVLEKIPSSVKTIVVDFHAEATSEKIAMGYFLEGKVTAVLGTHTHAATADGRILDGGTAYQTDVGMVGAKRSVLGREVSDVLHNFTTFMPGRLNVVETGVHRLDGVIVTFDHLTGKASHIEQISREFEV